MPNIPCGKNKITEAQMNLFQNLISPHLNQNGFLQLYGPTGLGKTSSFYYGEDALLKHTDRKVLFITYRKNILQDTCKQFREEGISYSFVNSQTENAILSAPHFVYPKQSHGYEELYDACKASAKNVEILSNKCKKPDLALVYKDELDKASAIFSRNTIRLCMSAKYDQIDLQEKLDKIKKAKWVKEENTILSAEYFLKNKGKLNRFDLPQDITEIINVMEKLANDPQFKEKESLHKQFEQKKKFFLMRFAELIRNKELIHLNLIQQTWVQHLFPAIRWRLRNEKVLVMTTDKAMMGFFDGEKIWTLDDLKDFIIVIDEFDYQNEQMALRLSPDNTVDNICTFIHVLMKNLSAYIKTVYEKDKQEKLIQYHQFCQSLIKERLGIDELPVNIAFPSLKDKQDALAHRSTLFARARSTAKTSYSFEAKENLILHPTKGVDLNELIFVFNVIRNSFKDRLLLSKDGLIDAKQEKFWREVIAGVFENVNDGQDSAFSLALREVTIKRMNYKIPELEYINLLMQKHFEEKGEPHPQYSRWTSIYRELNEFHVLTFNDNLPGSTIVSTNYYEMRKTPEKLIIDLLCNNNLIIGLSATMHLDRVIGNFNLPLIQTIIGIINDVRSNSPVIHALNLNKGDEKPKLTSYHPLITNQYFDKQEGKTLNEKMLSGVQLRENKRHPIANVHFKACKALPNSDTSYAMLLDKDEYKNNEAFKHAQEIAESFIRVLNYIKEHNVFSSIVFCNSFTALKSTIEHFHEIKDKGVAHDHYKIMQYKEEKFIFLLLNAKAMNNEDFFEHYYQVFDYAQKNDCKVVIVTQRQSASNGVNLNYSLNGVKQDLQLIAILDNNYHWFSRAESASSLIFDKKQSVGERSHMTKQIYQGARLNIDTDLLFNNKNVAKLYRGINKDLSLFADIAQQIGRCDRVWGNKDIHILLNEEAIEALQVYRPICHADYHSKVFNELMKQLPEVVDLNIYNPNIAAREIANKIWDPSNGLMVKVRKGLAPLEDFLKADEAIRNIVLFGKGEFALNGIRYSEKNFIIENPKRYYNHEMRFTDVQEYNSIPYVEKDYYDEFCSHLNVEMPPFQYHYPSCRDFVRGRYGEYALIKMLEERNIQVSQDYRPEVVEYYDFKVGSVYIDAKNYKELEFDVVKMSKHIKGLLEMDKNAVLYLVNIRNESSRRTYYDENGKSCNERNAKIIVMDSVIWNQMTNDNFNYLVKSCKNQ